MSSDGEDSGDDPFFDEELADEVMSSPVPDAMDPPSSPMEPQGEQAEAAQLPAEQARAIPLPAQLPAAERPAAQPEEDDPPDRVDLASIPCREERLEPVSGNIQIFAFLSILLLRVR
jgi:hypothetical protein